MNSIRHPGPEDLMVAARAGGVRDERVLEAVRSTRREAFVPTRYARSAYADEPIPISHGQVTSQPSLIAAMVAALGLTGTEKILEVGTGYGYQTALLARLAAQVISIDVWADMTDQARRNLTGQGIGNVLVLAGDGTQGAPGHGPFDAVIVSAAFPAVPPPLTAALVTGGRLVQPIGPGGGEDVIVYRKDNDGLSRERELTRARFVRLHGRYGYPPASRLPKRMAWLRLTLLGAGAMKSPRYPPAGLLVRYRRRQVMIDGGPGAEPAGSLAAWLVSDEHSELRRELRALAAAHGTRAAVATAGIADLAVEPHPVTHTSHPTWGYLLRLPTASAAWAPEFWQFPFWAAGVDLMFADAAGWNRPIRFAHGTGGHMAVLDVAEQARQHGVRRLVFAHIGRPSLRAIDAGCRLPFGEWGQPGRTYRVGGSPAASADAAAFRTSQARLKRDGARCTITRIRSAA